MTIYETMSKDFLAARIVPALVLVNLAVFLYQQSLSETDQLLFALKHGTVPRAFLDPQWAASRGLAAGDYSRLLYSAFMHHGWTHFLLNMATLLVFGPPVEARTGHIPFLLLYLGCAVLASLTHVYLNPQSQLPVMGASGAVAGLISAFAATSPPAFSIAALLLAATWFVIQLRHGVGELFSPNDVEGGVAWWAHIGGFLSGLLMLILLAPFRRRHIEPEARPPDRDWEKGPWG